MGGAARPRAELNARQQHLARRSLGRRRRRRPAQGRRAKIGAAARDRASGRPDQDKEEFGSALGLRAIGRSARNSILARARRSARSSQRLKSWHIHNAGRLSQDFVPSRDSSTRTRQLAACNTANGRDFPRRPQRDKPQYKRIACRRHPATGGSPNFKSDRALARSDKPRAAAGGTKRSLHALLRLRFPKDNSVYESFFAAESGAPIGERHFQAAEEEQNGAAEPCKRHRPRRP